LLELCSIATPHIAGYSTDGKANGTSMSVNALGRYFGIDTKNWFPSNVPLPEKTAMDINVSEDIPLEKLISEAVFFSYDAMDDDKNLRNSPQTFEKQRGDYPLRREFPVFSVKINGSSAKAEELKNALKNLGFRVL
jgi:erythronate-4-phosphate dehydrogenase